MTDENKTIECQHTVAPMDWKWYEEYRTNEIVFVNECTKCGQKVAVAIPKERFEAKLDDFIINEILGGAL